MAQRAFADKVFVIHSGMSLARPHVRLPWRSAATFVAPGSHDGNSLGFPLDRDTWKPCHADLDNLKRDRCFH